MPVMTTISDNLTIGYNSFPDSSNSHGIFKPSLKNSYAIIWLKEGKGKYFIDFREYQFRPSKVILISKNQDTSFQFSSKSIYVVITFTQDLVARSSEEIQKLLAFCIREHFEGKQILEISQNDAAYLGNLVDQMDQVICKWEGTLRKNSLFHLLQLFLLYCHQLSIEQSHGGLNEYMELVADFTGLLEKDFRKTQKVNHYAEHLNITYNGLSRYTADYCGKTPKEIIVERVILETKRLLANTKMPVKEIAYNLGFDEPTNMIKYFKKYAGLTPAAFRQSVLH